MERTLDMRRPWPLSAQDPPQYEEDALAFVPSPDDLQAVRIDMPCAAVGIAAPPCTIQAWFMATGASYRMLILCPPGRGPLVARWLEGHGLPGATVEPGLAPRSLWIHLTTLPRPWQPFLLDRAVQRIEMTPEGTTSLFIEDSAARTETLVDRIRDTAPEAHARPVLDADPSDVLTSRQKEVLAVAVASGYYEVPRRVTLRGLAKTMGLSAGAASELLRRGERTIITSLFDSGAAAAWTWDAPPMERADPKWLA